MPALRRDCSSCLMKVLSSLLKDLDLVVMGLTSGDKSLNSDGGLTAASLVDNLVNSDLPDSAEMFVAGDDLIITTQVFFHQIGKSHFYVDSGNHDPKSCHCKDSEGYLLLHSHILGCSELRLTGKFQLLLISLK